MICTSRIVGTFAQNLYRGLFFSLNPRTATPRVLSLDRDLFQAQDSVFSRSHYPAPGLVICLSHLSEMKLFCRMIVAVTMFILLKDQKARNAQPRISLVASWAIPNDSFPHFFLSLLTPAKPRWCLFLYMLLITSSLNEPSLWNCIFCLNLRLFFHHLILFSSWLFFPPSAMELH